MRKTLVAAVTAALTALATQVSGSAAGLATLSGPSPYAGCPYGAFPNAVNYPNAEVEPFVSVDPRDQRHLVAQWQQDRWSDGGAHGLASAYTFDGGRTWKQTQLPFTRCSTLPGSLRYDRASDPGVAIGPDGLVYSISLSFDGDAIRNAVAASVSRDGGRTWERTQTLITDAADPVTGNPFNDKELIFADHRRPGTAYAVWDRLDDVFGPNSNPRHVHPERAIDRSGGTVIGFTGPTYFSRTTDGGRTWSRPRVIVPAGNLQQTIANYLVQDPESGRLYDFFMWLDFNPIPGKQCDLFGCGWISFVTSDDGGATWSARHTVAEALSLAFGPGFSVTDPRDGAPLRVGDIIPIPAIDPDRGRLYVVWQDSRFSGGAQDEIAISYSEDHGSTWSPPARVNTPYSTGLGQSPAFTGTVAVGDDGSVAVSYYDFRELTPSTPATNLPTDVWITRSVDGGRTWQGERKMAGPFNMRTAPIARGFFVGDYEGLVAAGDGFQSVFVATTGDPNNRTDVYSGRFFGDN